MKKSILAVTIAAVFLTLQVTSGFAGLFGKSVEGIVQNVSSSMITVSQNDAEVMNQAATAEPTIVDLHVNNDTKFNDVESIAQLQSGDQVKVSYKEENGMNIATEIAKEAINAGQATY